MALCLAVAKVLAGEPVELKKRALFDAPEFLSPRIEGGKGNPMDFMGRHLARQAWPASPAQIVQLKAAERARESFDAIDQLVGRSDKRSVWRTIGPATESDEGLWEPKNSSGRVTDLAIAPNCDDSDCRLYLASAGGGVWRTDIALHPEDPAWRRLEGGLESNSIGAIVLDPNDPTANTLYVGTGEANFNYTSNAGRGMFRSTDGGDHFTRISTLHDGLDFTASRGISRILVQPGAPQTIYVATTTAMLGMTAVRGGQSTITGRPQAPVGLYRTRDGGTSWEFLYEVEVNTETSAGTPEGIYEYISGVKDVQLDPLDHDTVYISVLGQGIFRSSVALDGDSEFRVVFRVVPENFPAPDAYVAFAAVEKDNSTRIYAYNGNGNDLEQQGLFRLDDAAVSADNLNDQATGINRPEAWQELTRPLARPADYAEWRACNGQCVYDLVVAVPPTQPDTVYVGGQLTPYLGDSTLRSTDAGNSFTSMAIDLQEPIGIPHVDVRAIAFHPENPNIVFIGSDGGIVRSNGVFGDGRGLCGSLYGISPDDDFYFSLCQQTASLIPDGFIFMNRGLQTMQLYNISADPSGLLDRYMAGTQDNSTQWYSGSGHYLHWTKVFGRGDGTSANGFHPTDRNILFASYQSNYFFTHFNAGEGGDASWVHTSGPIRFSDDLADPVGPTGRQFMTFDPLDADTQYTGFEHIWRTRNNGGDRAFLESNCRLNDGWDKPECGDWEALGTYLTREEFGTDRQGGVIVAAERSAGDSGTLWAASSLGRLFRSRNIDAAAPAVSFERLDSEATPPRFVSGIAVDHQNPDRAFIAYSGFSAVTPQTPGHVFEVVHDGDQAIFTSIDYNLGDLPITHLVRDSVTGDLYAATDLGVLVLYAGTKSWEVAGSGLPLVMTPHLEIHPRERKLFAATHGLGAWFLNLSKPDPPATSSTDGAVPCGQSCQR